MIVSESISRLNNANISNHPMFKNIDEQRFLEIKRLIDNRVMHLVAIASDTNKSYGYTLLANPFGKANNNTKIRKSLGIDGYATASLSLAPSDTASVFSERYENLCPMAKRAKCESVCLMSSGLGGIHSAAAIGRLAKSVFFIDHKDLFVSLLRRELDRFEKACKKRNLDAAARLNVLTDILWERMGLIEDYPRIQFYDYTKIPTRGVSSAWKMMMDNYDVTHSLSWSITKIDDFRYLDSSRRYAMVVCQFTYDRLFKVNPNAKYHMVDNAAYANATSTVPMVFVNGDIHDLTFLHPAGTVLVLKAKGRARKPNDFVYYFSPVIWSEI